jgi:2-oxoglutarate dehydrogenase E2 component (dihydrolipoamide succinyltransferase)
MAEATDVASVEVRMPQMGETVTEGTITAWLKAPGDAIAVDEPLLEISTDKVDSEIPSPVAGTVAELVVPEGETVPIGELIARIATGDGAPTAPADAEPAAPEPPAEPPPPPPPPEPVLAEIQDAPTAQMSARTGRSNGEVTGFLSPVVRKLVDEHELDPSSIDGSGRDGRITRDDVLALVEAHPPTVERPGVRHLPFTAIRRTIARNLTHSLATAAHTLVVVEVDYSAVAPVREAAGLTWLPFIARAAIDALRDFPLVNAHVGADALEVHDDVHLGMAVDLDFEGLVVPVLRHAGDLRLRALADALNQRAAAARDHTLAADDYAGGTFTLTNAGRYGTLFTAPIINQPQAAILSTDGVKVRPVALPLADGGYGLGFHPVGNLALSFDHRAFDGAYASAFAARVRDNLEQRDWEDEAR